MRKAIRAKNKYQFETQLKKHICSLIQYLFAVPAEYIMQIVQVCDATKAQLPTCSPAQNIFISFSKNTRLKLANRFKQQ